MIISHIIGGLGNQMFQYAAGRVLALERDQSFRLDISDFSEYALHQGFELQRVFNCDVQLATDAEIRDALGWQHPKIVRKVIERPQFSFLRCKGLVVEPHFEYWSGIKQAPDDCYLKGYWQSERYFQSQAETIRSDFTFKTPLAGKNTELVAQITQVNAVSLHIRRGDYANNPKTTATHGLCSLDYYRSAVQYIVERVRSPHFFIFSDDIAWVKQNLVLNFPHQYIDYNEGLESYNDMRLMSLCQHNIIANSSFSWWGAWLNFNKEKLVIAPEKWFMNKNHLDDIFPSGWVVL